ncbi:TPA: hypothetical protein ACVEY8_000033 [Yersinia enterocolitica]|jgi:hypothetical protein|uniref:hypothetical protein n=1 Tax=Yersinia enterocolitica TaxID=630 RepID=UPI0028543915|nr:hypothetical protein [Yersinia enterocolitica]HDL8133220.1 hypothetical protein [Yersinia enterocolitica]HDV7162602.1 hypothetical protein [Yersinia enterocolitica]HEB2010238.1 hypothetical protein [Yersinia enterocolitica]HEB9653130.1 hypothetical protein [Yersinia enterocolitica]
MSIIILDSDWGDISTSDIQCLINSAINLMDPFYGKPIHYNIEISNTPNIDSPMVYNSRGVSGQYHINLTTKGHDYSQFYYQFFHEYCHVRTNYLAVDNKYSWFEESVCELASMFGVKRMAFVWKKEKVLPNAKNNFGYSIEKYIQRVICNPRKNLPKQQLFKKWLNENIEYLECERYDRDKNGIVANKLLSLFERESTLWELMTYWNKWEINHNDSIYEAFDKWSSILPEEKKAVAQKLINVFS